MDYYQSLKRGSEIDSAVTYVNEKLPQKVNDIEDEIAELKSSKLDKTSYNTNVYTKEEVNAKLSSVYFYKGTKTVDEINAISVDELTAGWTYNVSDSGKITVGSQAVTVHQGDNVSWTGEFWDKLASDIDFSAYYTKTEVEDYVDATIDEKSLTADDDDSGNVTLQIAAATDIDGKDSEIDTYFFENYPKIYRIQDSMDSLSDTSVGYYILFVTSEYSSLDMTNLTRQYKFQNGSIYTRLGNSLNGDDAWSDWEKVDGGTTDGVTDVKVNGTSVTANGVANISIDIVSGKESKVDTYFYEGAQTIYKIDGNEGMVYGGAEYFLFVTGSYDPFAMFYRSYQYKFVNCAIYARSETEVNSRIWNDWKKIDGNMTDVKVNGTSVVTDGVANIPIATKAKPGVVRIGDSSSVGLAINSTGAIYIAAASPSQIDAHANSYNPIVPSNLPYAVRSVYPDSRYSVPSAYEINTIYTLGQQTNLAITLPSGKVGSFIQIDFISGTTPTTLSVTSSAGILGFDLVPEANMIYSLYFDWGIVSSAASYGWRFTYSEYDISTTGG